jgi:hypothetical protein
MKRFLVIVLASALAVQGALAFAQDAGEPSEESVLDAARAKYWGANEQQKDASAAEAPAQAAAPADQEPDAVVEGGDEPPSADENLPPPRAEPGRKARYFPFLISFAPGLSVPFGYRDTSIAVGVVGSLARDVRGIDGSSVFSIARDIDGAEAAGVFVIARNVRGFQGAGVFDVAAGALQGVQAAGLFTIAEKVHGFQGAGLFNIAGDVRGAQAAGLFNVARDVHGVQVGLVNVAREVDGMQIGLVNIAGNGVDSIGLVYEPETDYLYAYWQAGSPFLYTTVGYGSTVSDYRWDNGQSAVASIGLGSRTRFLGLKIDADLSAEQPVGNLPYGSFDYCDPWTSWDGWALIAPYPTVKLSLGLPIGRHFQLIAGFKADIDIASLGARVPSALKAGRSWSGRAFGEDYSVWTKWYFGFKL